MLLKTSQMKDFVILIMTLNIICLLLVFTSVLSDSLRNCSRKWENKSTRDLFTDRQKRYCTGLHFNGFPSVPPSLHGIDQRWLDIEKSYRWNYIHLNSLGANRFSIVLFIVLRNTGLRLRESFVDFSFLKGKQWKKIDCKYLFIPNGCTNTFSETKNEYRYFLQYLVVADIVENQPEITGRKWWNRNWVIQEHDLSIR